MPSSVSEAERETPGLIWHKGGGEFHMGHMTAFRDHEESAVGDPSANSWESLKGDSSLFPR